ncbi:SGNH/GDSL hydrolase family protein [Gemmatimonadota bacterium]
MRVSVIGNSVGMRIRPPCRGKQDMLYSARLAGQGHEVSNHTRAGIMINEAFGYLDDEVITEHPDFVILNFGIVEVCFRQTPRRLQNSLIHNYYLNQLHGRPFMFLSGWRRVRHLILRVINGSIRRGAVILNLRWQWFRTERFMTVMKSMIDVLLKETSAEICLIGINPCTARIERVVRGTSEEISRTNALLRELAASYPARIHFLDPIDVLGKDEAADLVPDGIHYSAEGHRLMAESLQRLIEDIEPH